MKIKDIISKETRAAVYSATVEAVSIKEVLADIKAGTLANEIADAIVDAFKADNYRQFVETMTSYGPLRTAAEVNAWWTFVKNVKHGVSVATAAVEAVLFNEQVKAAAPIAAHKKVTVKQVVEMFAKKSEPMWETAGDSDGNGFCFDLQRFCEKQDVVQQAFDDIERLVNAVTQDTVLYTTRELGKRKRALVRTKDKFSPAEFIKIMGRIETEIHYLREPFSEQLDEFAKLDVNATPSESLYHYMKAAEILFRDDIRDTILAEFEQRKQRRAEQQAQIARESDELLFATLDNFGNTPEERLENVRKKYNLILGHALYADMPNREDVLNRLVDLKKEARDAVKVAKKRDVLERLKNGQQDCSSRTKARVIRSLHEAEERMKEMLQREGKGMAVTKLHFASKGQVLTSQHYQDYGYTVRKLEELGQVEQGKLLDSYNIVRKLKRFCRAYIMVSVADMCALANFCSVGKENEIWGFRAIYRTIDPAGYDRFWVHVANGNEHFMVDLCSNEKSSEYNKTLKQNVYKFGEWKTVFAVNGYYKYDGSWATSSPGELKNKVVMVPGQYVHSDPIIQASRQVNWGLFFDEGTSGAWTEFCNKRNTSELTFSDIAEFTARITLLNAYAKYFYEKPMRAFAVYTGKFKAKKDSGLIAEGHQFMDGLFVYRAEYIAAVLEQALKKAGENVTVDPDAVVGMGLQSRPFNTKGFALTITASAIANMIKRTTVDGVDRINLYVPKMTAEQRKAWWNLSFNKFKSIDGMAKDGGTNCLIDGEVVDLAEKVLVFYYDKEAYEKQEIPDCLVDGNALKVGHEINKKRKPVAKVLAMAHKDKGENVTSTQMLYAYFANDYQRTMKQLEVILDIMLQDIEKRLTNEEGEIPSIADFTGRYDIYTDRETGEEVKEWIPPLYGDIVNKIAPIIATRYSFGAWRKKVDKEVERLSRRIERLNLPIEGTHVTIVPDLGMVFGGGISVLGVREDGVTDLFSNNPLATTLTKEEYVAKYKTLAAAANVPAEVQKDFEDMVNSLSPGIVAVPADEITARANEGWDFDGDSMYLFKMHKGYIKEIGTDGNTHYRWAEDGETPDGFVTFGHGNRYPKTHPDGFMKILPECWLGQPVCVYIA